MHSWMSPFASEIGKNVGLLCRQADDSCSVFVMQLNNVHNLFIPKFLMHFYASSGISSFVKTKF